MFKCLNVLEMDSDVLKLAIVPVGVLIHQQKMIVSTKWYFYLQV